MSPSRIEHDRDRCITMGVCESLAPEYFEVRDDGSMVLRRDLVEPADLDAVRQAVHSCPTGALRIVEGEPAELG
jgi:ferredoxin